MPRATSTSTEETTVKKAPRKRATSTKTTAAKKATPRKTTTRKTPAKKTTTAKASTKKTATKKKNPPVTEQEVELFEVDTESDMSSTRKAPTKFAAEKARKKTRRNQYIVIGLLIMVGVGASAAVGLSDSEAGQINVAQTIRERNERMANLVDVNGPTIVVPTPSQVPDGGLIGLRPADPAQSPEPSAATSTAGVASSTIASSTASSTATTATSTIAAEITETPEGATGTSSPADSAATDTATTTVDAVEPESVDQQVATNLE